MQEFVRAFKQVLKVRGSELLIFAGIAGISIAIAIVLMLVIILVEGSQTFYVNMSAVLVLVVGIMLFFALGVNFLSKDFNMAVSMGKARKYFVLSRYVFLVLELLVVFGIAGVAYLVEPMIYQMIFPTAVCEIDVSRVMFQPIILISALLCLPAMVLLFGALSMRFGKKFFWAGWTLWMLSCFGIPKMIPVCIEQPDSLPGKISRAVISFFANGTTMGIILTFVGIAVLCMAAAMYFFRRQRVTV